MLTPGEGDEEFRGGMSGLPDKEQTHMLLECWDGYMGRLLSSRTPVNHCLTTNDTSQRASDPGFSFSWAETEDDFWGAQHRPRPLLLERLYTL